MTRAVANSAEPVIVTPDQRLRVFISGGDDLRDERAAAAALRVRPRGCAGLPDAGCRRGAWAQLADADVRALVATAAGA